MDDARLNYLNSQIYTVECEIRQKQKQLEFLYEELNKVRQDNNIQGSTTLLHEDSKIAWRRGL